MPNPNTELGGTAYIAKKVEHAGKALVAYPGRDSFDFETSITDLIADLMHLANSYGWQGAILAEAATKHFLAEGGDGAYVRCKTCTRKMIQGATSAGILDTRTGEVRRVDR